MKLVDLMSVLKQQMPKRTPILLEMGHRTENRKYLRVPIGSCVLASCMLDVFEMCIIAVS